MRISISNIAWDPSVDADIATTLAAAQVDAIDVAPGKYFKDPLAASDAEIRQVASWWGAHGIEIVGMQALLFGTAGLNLFGPTESRDAMLRHLDAVCRVGAGLGASWLVFGSPKNRDRTGIDDGPALEIACSFFQRLGDIAGSHGVHICLEPNPTRYGCNFMTTAEETAGVVGRVGHACIRMQLDTGALTISGENPVDVLSRHSTLIGHVHASEPDLVRLGSGMTDHEAMASVIRAYIPNHIVCVEMLPTSGHRFSAAVAEALALARATYG